MLLKSRDINLRVVEIKDAEFILSLRRDKNKNKYLSKINESLKEQIKWLQAYKDREAKKLEYYFVIESKAKEKLGLVRLYDFRGDSFCWGSFIIKDNAPFYASIQAVLAVYDFGFYSLNFKQSHFDVRKDNKQVLAFHKRFGAVIVDESELDFYFKISLEQYEKSRKKYEKFTL